MDRVSEGLIDTILAVDASDHHAGHLLSERSDLALLPLKRAQFLLSLPHDLRIVIPGVRPGTDALPIVLAWHLISLGEAFAVVELPADVDHAQLQRALDRFSIAIDEYVIVRAVSLEIGRLDRTWDVCVSLVFAERMTNL